jgi:hypothetical protein
MTTVVPAQLTRTAERVRAAAIVAAALRCPTSEAITLVETIDTLSAAVLRIAGMRDAAIRAVLAALWSYPATAPIPAAEPGRRLRLTDREGEFLLDLGERVHILRRARWQDAPAVWRSTGIPADQLFDIERGTGVPTALAQYRLADLLEVPLPMPVDSRTSPLDMLRDIAARDRP